jgi:predicted XRE-type DNA-binding protein
VDAGAAAKAIGVTQPRVNDLLRGWAEKFSIDALVVCLGRIGVRVKVRSIRPDGAALRNPMVR